jgi:hypothetical protein
MNAVADPAPSEPTTEYKLTTNLILRRSTALAATAERNKPSKSR